MMVTFISECEKKALNRTRRVLDAFANRTGLLWVVGNRSKLNFQDQVKITAAYSRPGAVETGQGVSSDYFSSDWLPPLPGESLQAVVDCLIE